MYNINELSERAIALEKRLANIQKGIQDAREELARIWGYKLPEEEPVKKREVLHLRSYFVGMNRYLDLRREAPYHSEIVADGFILIDEALQWAKANGYVVYGYTQQPEQ